MCTIHTILYGDALGALESSETWFSWMIIGVLAVVPLLFGALLLA